MNPDEVGKVLSDEYLGGLLKSYRRAAQLRVGDVEVKRPSTRSRCAPATRSCRSYSQHEAK